MIEFVSSNGQRGARRIIDVDDFWHNSLRSLPPNAGPGDREEDRQLLEAIRQRGFPAVAGHAPAANPIGARQGSSLARLLKEFGYRWNGGDGTRCIQAQTPPVELSGGVEIEVIGPRLQRLEALRSWWMRGLRRLSYRGSGQISDLVEDAYEMWWAAATSPGAARIKPITAVASRRLGDVYVQDTSLTNASSITVILRGEGTTMLFLGDAGAEDVNSQFETIGLSTPLFDVIKIAHHGSKSNSSVELLQQVDAPCFLISSDGSRHGHPDFEVLAEIVDRPAPFERAIYFNYETPAARQLRAYTSRSHTPFRVHMSHNDWINIGEYGIDRGRSQGR
jgi:hypothetical protein